MTVNGYCCKSCQGNDFVFYWQVFKNGTRHLGMDCLNCRTFQMFLNQNDRTISLIDNDYTPPDKKQRKEIRKGRHK